MLYYTVEPLACQDRPLVVQPAAVTADAGWLELTNGMLRLWDPASTNCPSRFYRIIEQ